MTAFLRTRARTAVAVAVVLALYPAARLPSLSQAERTALSGRFRFVRTALPTLPGGPRRDVRTVLPALDRISAWISSVGASVALGDVDGDGLPNDACHVETASDRVVVAPVPGTAARYAPFALDPAPLRYDRTMAPTGCNVADLNQDGLTDLLVSYWGRSPVAFLRRDGTGAGVRLGSGSYVAQEIVPETPRWFTDALTLADLDGDGHVDLVVGNYFADGDRILDPTARDVDRMQHSMSRAKNGAGVRFLVWAGASPAPNPQVRFRELRGTSDDRVLHGWTLAVGAADLDGDLLPEVYVANDFGPDRLLSNRSTPGHLRFVTLHGRKTFLTPNSKVVGRDSFKGMGVDFGDLNGDGRLDIVVSNITTSYALEESNFAFVSTGPLALIRHGVAPFVDRSEALGLSRSGWSWDSRLADFDSDGVPEVMQATGFVQGRANRWPELQELAIGNDELLSHPGNWPRLQPGDDLSGHEHPTFFVRAADGRYFDLAPDVGLGTAMVSRGIATADVDGDGRLDFAIANQWERSYFYRNVSRGVGAMLGLDLRLPATDDRSATTVVRPGHPGRGEPSYPAIGATAVVRLPDGRRLVQQVDGGNGHSGRRAPELLFGLGRIRPGAILPVDLSWRDPAGRVHRQTVHLSPGWHTAVLGWSA